MPIEINKVVRLVCPLSPILFNIYVDKVIKDWLQVIDQNIFSKGRNPKYNLIRG
jgi:hypothetical protein